MAKILILYGTNNGQARKVAERMEIILKSKGHQVEMVQGNKAREDFSPEGFDAAIVGTSIYMGEHQISVRQLVRAWSDAFNRIPTAYFCVCITATQTTPEAGEQMEGYIQAFADYTGLKPVKTAVFAGALKYPEYNFVKRFAAKLLARKLDLDTDTKQYFEYTDWSAVARFVEEFAEVFPKQA